MTHLTVHIEATGIRAGSVVPIEIVDPTSGRTLQAAIRCGVEPPIDLNPDGENAVDSTANALYVRAILADGRVLCGFADTGDEPSVTLRSITAEGPREGSLMPEASRSSAEPQSAPQAAEVISGAPEPYTGLWTRLWRPPRVDDPVAESTWLPNPAERREQDPQFDGSNLEWNETGIGGWVLQVGGDDMIHRCIVLPPAERVTITVARVTGAPYSFSGDYVVTARSEHEYAEALLEYGRRGDLHSAQTIADYYKMAHKLLDPTHADPLGAVVSGYHLLRSREIDPADPSPGKLADTYPGIPDAAIVRIGQILQSPEPDPKEAHERIRQAVGAGLPSYSIGLRWLYRAASLLLTEMPDDDELQTVHRQLHQLADSVDWDAALVTFRGTPLAPSAEHRTGPPPDRLAPSRPHPAAPDVRGRNDYATAAQPCR